ncbi:MAG: hypothetical protein WCK49_00480 [Myxococcaceae bacterium]
MKPFVFMMLLMAAPIHASQVHDKMARNACIALAAGLVLVGPAWWVILLATPEGSRFLSNLLYR